MAEVYLKYNFHPTLRMTRSKSVDRNHSKYLKFHGFRNNDDLSLLLLFSSKSVKYVPYIQYNKISVIEIKGFRMFDVIIE